MLLNVLYFVQVNLICVIFLVFIERRISCRPHIHLGDKIFRFSIICSEVLCITDAVAGIYNGSPLRGIPLLLHGANNLYFLAGILSAGSWFYFVCIRFKISMNKRQMILAGLPLAVSVVMMVCNQYTKHMYYIDDHNFYVRGPLLFIFWIMIFIYLLQATIISILMTKREYNRVVRKANISFCVYGIFPTIGFVFQIHFFGSSTITVGLALGYLFYYLSSIESQISEDFLTGLNNRKQLEKYTEELIHKGCDNPIYMVMMDINDFKQINDKYGHAAGDDALTDFATALKRTCKDWHGNYIICRYGGDEFSIAGELDPGTDLSVLVELIKKNTKEISIEKHHEYNLNASIGYSYSVCKKSSDINRIHLEADQKMYEEKRRIKEARKSN